MDSKSNRTICGIFASLCGACLLFASDAFALGCSDWTEVTTQRFRLYGELKPDKALQIAESLNRFQAAIEVVTNARVTDSDTPTTLVVYDYGDWLRFIPPQMLGLFYAEPFENFLLIPNPANRGSNPYTVVMHEYVHFILRSQKGFSYPTWYNEGLAEVLSASREEGETFQLGLMWRERLADAQRSFTWSPLKEVLNNKGPAIDLRNPAHTSQFYGQATLLAHYLLFSQTRQPQLVAYLKALNDNVPPDKAFADSFGISYEQLDNEVREYARQKDFKMFRLPKTLLAMREKPTVRPIPCGEGMLKAGEALLQIGANPSEVSSRFFKDRDKTGPAAGWRLARADAALRSKDIAKANAYIDEALKLSDLSGSELLTAAELLISEVHRATKSEDELSDEDKALLDRVRSLLANEKVRALKSPRMAHAVAEVALLSDSGLDDAREVAIGALERAPRNSYLAEVTALLCLRKGDLENAGGAWSIVAAYAREPNRREHAKKELAIVDAASKQPRQK